VCRSTCFGLLHAHYQELTTALTASGFTLERGGSSVASRGLADYTSGWLICLKCLNQSIKVNFPLFPTLYTVIDVESQEFLPHTNKDQLNTAKKNV